MCSNWLLHDDWSTQRAVSGFIVMCFCCVFVRSWTWTVIQSHLYSYYIVFLQPKCHVLVCSRNPSSVHCLLHLLPTGWFSPFEKYRHFLVKLIPFVLSILLLFYVTLFNMLSSTLIVCLIYSMCCSVVWSSFITVLTEMWTGVFCWIRCQITHARSGLMVLFHVNVA